MCAEKEGMAASWEEERTKNGGKRAGRAKESRIADEAVMAGRWKKQESSRKTSISALCFGGSGRVAAGPQGSGARQASLPTLDARREESSIRSLWSWISGVGSRGKATEENGKSNKIGSLVGSLPVPDIPSLSRRFLCPHLWCSHIVPRRRLWALPYSLFAAGAGAYRPPR